MGRSINAESGLDMSKQFPHQHTHTHRIENPTTIFAGERSVRRPVRGWGRRY
jgi:hypothetical protein